MIEIWKTIKEAPDYDVSNLGNVRFNGKVAVNANGVTRYYKPHIVKTSTKKCGYLEVTLTIDTNKRVYRTVHRLVLVTFNPIDGMENFEVNHLDENKKNNRLDNLEWVTSKENCNYGTRNQRNGELSSISVRCIETGIVYRSCKEASEKTGVSRAVISRNINGLVKYSRKYNFEVVK